MVGEGDTETTLRSSLPQVPKDPPPGHSILFCYTVWARAGLAQGTEWEAEIKDPNNQL